MVFSSKFHMGNFVANFLSHTIHVWYVYLHLPLKNPPTVGKYTVRPMDAMGLWPILFLPWNLYTPNLPICLNPPGGFPFYRRVAKDVSWNAAMGPVHAGRWTAGTYNFFHLEREMIFQTSMLIFRGVFFSFFWCGTVVFCWKWAQFQKVKTWSFSWKLSSCCKSMAWAETISFSHQIQI